VKLRTWQPALVLLMIGLDGPIHARPGVEIDYNKSIDFHRYKTFAWAPFQTPVANAANHIRITVAVERELQAKGLTKADPPESADVFVHYEGYLEKNLEGTASRSESPWQPSNPRFVVDFSRVEVGTIVIDVWDAQRKDIVWHAKGRERFGPADEIEQRINHLVRALFARFPPKTKSG
jgi:hypothetical protein